MELELCEDVVVARELITHLALVPQLLAIGNDNEVTAAALDELDLSIGVSLTNRRGQTGRFWFVVSQLAVFDGDDHLLFWISFTMRSAS